MRENEFKLFPESVTRKLFSLKEEGISQDIEVFPVLLFVGIRGDTHFSYERILRTIKDICFPFRGEILEVRSDYIVISFDIFRNSGDESARAISLARLIIDLEFVEFVFIAKRRGFFRYVNIKGREFAFIDNSAYTEYMEAKRVFDKGIFVDENIYYELYHNINVEPIENRVLRVLSVRDQFIPRLAPVFVGKNPLSGMSRGNIFTVRGDKGTGKSRVSLQFLWDGGFDRIAYVKLRPDSIAIPFSAISELMRSLEFYVKSGEDENPLSFLKRIFSNDVKTGVFFENAKYLDADSQKALGDLITHSSNSIIFIFEQGPRWEDEITVLLENYVESKGISILKSIAGGRKPDKTVLEVLNSIKDRDYRFIQDFYNIFALKKYFIFGEDVFYLSPMANPVKENFSRERLYELLFETMNEVEIKQFSKLVLYGGTRKLKDIRLSSLVRLIRHGILRVDGDNISVSSNEIKERFFRWLDKDRILVFLEKELPESEHLIRGHVLRFIGEKRPAFRELKRYLNSLEPDRQTRRYVLLELLKLEPVDREKIDLLMELYNVEKNNGNYDLAISYLKESLKVAKIMEDREKIASVLYELGKFNLEIGQSGAALMNFKDAMRFAKEASDKRIYVTILLKMVEFYWNRNDLKKMGELLNELNSTDVTDDKHKGKILYYKGIYYLESGNINKAHSILETAYDLTRKLNDNFLTSRILASLSRIEFSFGQYKIAERYAKEALSMNPECVEGSLMLSRAKFVEGNIDESFRILYRVSTGKETRVSSLVLLDLAALCAYKGHYKTGVEYLDKLVDSATFKDKNKVLKRKTRYLLRLGRYAEAFDLLSNLNDAELKDEFNIFLMADKYEPKLNTPYLKAVISFATLSKIKDLDFSSQIDYDYIDAGWMVEFNRGINELISGSYESAYEVMKKMENTYFKSTLGVNIAKYVIDRGGDGNIFLREAGEIAEKENYLEVLMWIYLILGKKDKAEGLLYSMFGDNIELRNNYIRARREVFEKI